MKICPTGAGLGPGLSPANPEPKPVTLRDKAEAWDKGKEAWAVFSPQGILQTNSIAEKQQQSINRHAVSQFDTWSKREKMGYTCRRVRVCGEVES